MKHLSLVAIAAGLTLGLFASKASAEEKTEKSVTTLPTTTVQGRPQKPGVVIVLTRAKMDLVTKTPTLDSVIKVQDATKKDPF